MLIRTNWLKRLISFSVDNLLWLFVIITGLLWVLSGLGLGWSNFIDQKNGNFYTLNLDTSKAPALFWTFIAFIIAAVLYEINNLVILFLYKKTLGMLITKSVFLRIKDEVPPSPVNLGLWKITNYFFIAVVPIIAYFIFPTIWKYLIIGIYYLALIATSFSLSCSVSEIVTYLQKQNFSGKHADVSVLDYSVLGSSKKIADETRGETVSSLWDEKYADGSFKSKTLEDTRKVFDAFKTYKGRVITSGIVLGASVIGIGVSSPFVAKAAYDTSIFNGTSNYFTKYTEIDLHYGDRNDPSKSADQSTVVQNLTQQLKSIYAINKDFFKVGSSQYIPDNLQILPNGSNDVLISGPSPLVNNLSNILGAWTTSDRFTLTDQWGHPIVFGADPLTGWQMPNISLWNTQFTVGYETHIDDIGTGTQTTDTFNYLWSPYGTKQAPTPTEQKYSEGWITWLKQVFGDTNLAPDIQSPQDLNEVYSSVKWLKDSTIKPIGYNAANPSESNYKGAAAQYMELRALAIKMGAGVEDGDTNFVLNQETTNQTSGWKILNRYLTSIYELSSSGKYFGQVIDGGVFNNVFAITQPGDKHKPDDDDLREILNFNIIDSSAYKAYTGFLYWYLNPSYSLQNWFLPDTKKDPNVKVSGVTKVDKNYTCYENKGATQSGVPTKCDGTNPYDRNMVLTENGSQRLHGYIFYWYASQNQVNKYVNTLKAQYDGTPKIYDGKQITATDTFTKDSLLFWMFNTHKDDADGKEDDKYGLNSDGTRNQYTLTYDNSQGYFFNQQTDLEGNVLSDQQKKDLTAWNKWYLTGQDYIFANNYTKDNDGYAKSFIDPTTDPANPGSAQELIKGIHVLAGKFKLDKNHLYQRAFNPLDTDYPMLVGVYTYQADDSLGGSVSQADNTHKFNYLIPGSSGTTLDFNNSCDQNNKNCTGNNFTYSSVKDDITYMVPFLRATMGNYYLNVVGVYTFPPTFYSDKFVVAELISFAIISLLVMIWFFWRYKKLGWLALWAQVVFLFTYLLTEVALSGIWLPSAMFSLIGAQAIVLIVMALFFEKMRERRLKFEKYDIDIENYKKVLKDRNVQILEIMLVIFTVIYLTYTILFSQYKAVGIRWMFYFAFVIAVINYFAIYVLNTIVLKNLMDRNGIPTKKEEYIKYLAANNIVYKDKKTLKAEKKQLKAAKKVNKK